MFRHHGMHMIEGVGDDTDEGGTNADESAGTDTQAAADTDKSTTADTAADKGDEIDWKAMARKHEAEAKKNRAAAAKLDAIEAKSRTAEENAAKAAADAKNEADAARAELAVERAARKHGLTDDKDLDVLQGLPADKVEAVAKALAASRKTADASGKPAGGGKGPTKPTTLGGALAAHYNS